MFQNKDTNLAEFSEIARKWWTPDRVKKLGGKSFALSPDKAPELLRALELLNADATMSRDNLRKFIQVNHIINLLEPHLIELKSQNSIVRILDAGCGKSYLSFILAWCFKEKWNHPCEILGVDGSENLISKCRKMAEALGYDDVMKFDTDSLGEFVWRGDKRPNMVVGLHACDTATDFALAIGIKNKADFIAVAPCCQAELAAKWKGMAANSDHHFLKPVFCSPNLRREIAAQMTDTLRVCLTRAHGYEVTATEFVPSQHTPKNRLIICKRRGNFFESSRAEYEKLKDSLGGCSIILEEKISG